MEKNPQIDDFEDNWFGLAKHVDNQVEDMIIESYLNGNIYKVYYNKEDSEREELISIIHEVKDHYNCKISIRSSVFPTLRHVEPSVRKIEILLQ